MWLNFDAFKALSRKEALLILMAKSLHPPLIGRAL
jgi:ribosomal protein L7Ae-like RNA K-turn-binding protein